MTTTIGSQTNVPDPGAPITSPWAQDTARKLVHAFANATARDAWTTRPDGAFCVTLDDDRIWRYTGTAWAEVASIAAGNLVWGQLAGSNYWTNQNQFNGNVFSGATGAGNPGIDRAGAWQAAAGRYQNNIDVADTPNLTLDRQAVAVGQPFVLFRRFTTTIGSVALASSTAVVYNTTSDPRLKHRSGDVDGAAAAAQTLGHAAFRGRWINPDTGEPEGDEDWVFLSSHDVADVAPYAVTGQRDAVDDDGNIVPQQVDYGSLVPLLFAALAEALDRIDALEAAAT